jgi:periplasmic copper chaperone A
MLRQFKALALAIATTTAIATLAGCGSDTTASDNTAAEEPSAAPASVIIIEDGWVRATEGTEDTSMTAAFMSLTNPGEADITLTAGSAEVAEMTQLHEMVEGDDGAMMMQEIDGGLVVPATGHQHLEPGGNHVMLMGLTEELAPGDEVALTLTFDDGTTQDLMLPVKAFTEEEPHYHDEAEDADMDMEESPSP